MRVFRQRTRSRERLRIYYASDVHGSGVCWRKFINAGAHYSADALIMGGDLTGKGVILVIRNRDGVYSAHILGESRLAESDAELQELEDAIRTNGMYPCRVDSWEAEALRTDRSAVESLFEREITRELSEWIVFAEQRLKDSPITAYVIPGNDDPWFVDGVFDSAEHVILCDERIVRIQNHEVLSFGSSNTTPWHTPRELSEEEIYRRLRSLSDQLEDPASAVFNIHVPPYATGLDTACEVDEDLRLVFKGGQPHEIAIGSPAVRQLIEEVQPAVSLHGHVHESRGVTKLGRTHVINPGSEYTTGRLEGCIVDLNGSEVVRQRLLSG
jgi:Icc-related predicted phosphoesterase